MQSALDYGEAGAGSSQPQAQTFHVESENNVRLSPLNEKPDDLHENQDDARAHQTGCSGNRAFLARKIEADPAVCLDGHAPFVRNGAPSNQHIVEPREILLAMLQLIAAVNRLTFYLFKVFLSWFLLLSGQEHSAIRVGQRCVQHALNLLVASLRDGDDAACKKCSLQDDLITHRTCAAWEPNGNSDSSGGTAWPAGSTHGPGAALPTGDPSERDTRGPGRPRVYRKRRKSTREPGGSGGDDGRGDGRSGSGSGGRGGGGGGGAAQPSRPRATPDESRLWACHFSLLPDGGSNDCPGFKRPTDIPTHLRRKHRQPKHCPQCKITLKNDNEEQQHILAGMTSPCIYSDYVHPGMTPDQWDDIKNRSPRQGTPEQRWNDIWHILFPQVSRPPSPYIVSPFTCRLRREISRFQQDGHLQSVVDGIVPVGPSYDSHSFSAQVIQCLHSFVEHVEREAGAARVPTPRRDINVGMDGTPSPLPVMSPPPPAPSLPPQELFQTVPVTFTFLVPPRTSPIGPPGLESLLNSGDSIYMPGTYNAREALGGETRYEIPHTVLPVAVYEEYVDEGAPDTQ